MNGPPQLKRSTKIEAAKAACGLPSRIPAPIYKASNANAFIAQTASSKSTRIANLAAAQLIENKQSGPRYPVTHFQGRSELILSCFLIAFLSLSVPPCETSGPAARNTI
jgi:hypothetical protein